MQWSYKIGAVFGIPLRLHITFPMLIIAYAALFGYEYGLMAAVRGFFLILFLFGCVVLHELAHSKQAQKYGVKVRDVTLLPIGGVSNMEHIPEDPTQELKIAIVGPLTSLAIGVVLLIADFAAGFDIFEFSFERIATDWTYFPVYMAWINVFLAFFNLLPAFPMDGGRVIRAYLAQKTSYVRATKIAATIGKIFAIIFGVAGVLINPILIFIAFFVYLGASSEEQAVMVGEGLKGLQVKDVMNTQCVTIPAETSLSELVEKIFDGTCRGVIPVTEKGVYIGLASQETILSAIHEHGLTVHIGKIARRDLPVVSPEDNLSDVYKKMQRDQEKAYAVVYHGELVGVISLEDLGRAYTVVAALRSGKE
ncbi:MAG: site-2 protease family protein [Theionarchaea archaeon]|nr:site-2 protease family protein [Theionarchaea archaeon]